MVKYIRGEGYKLLHRTYTWVALSVFLGFVVLLMCLWWATNSHGGFVPLSGALHTLVMALSIGLYAPIITTDIVVSEQYKIGTLKNEVSFGIPRGRIYLGKLAAGVGASVVACVLAIGLYLLLCVATLSEGADPDGMFMARLDEMWKQVSQALLSAFPLWLGAQGVSHMCAYLFRGGITGPFATLGIIIGVPGVLKMLGLMLDPVFFTIRKFTLVAPMDNWTFPVWQCWVIGLGWFAASTLVGLIAFQKKEIS